MNCFSERWQKDSGLEVSGRGPRICRQTAYVCVKFVQCVYRAARQETATFERKIGELAVYGTVCR